MSVLLLRSPEGVEPYLAAFRQAGVEASCLDVMTFSYVGVEAMRLALRQPERFGGLVVTSPRTTEAWRRDDEARSLLSGWAAHPTYAVGPRTAAEARALGLEPEGQAQGGAQALASYITGNRPDKPLLFCCGRPRQPDLPTRLEQADIPVEEVVVYESTLLLEPPAGPVPDVVVFFSPRAAAVMERWDWPWSRVRKAWVGDSASRLATGGEVTAPYHDVDGLVSRLTAVFPLRAII
ncbi:MAG: uroporphyrinogen-III synthase [Rhodothermales bacterium]|jgi:uroporphyrinogen-III synthase